MAFHHEDVEEFRAALTYTRGRTGFSAELMEKDYFCSLVLQHIYSALPHDLAFKGGTCLNKVYLGFFRLSEDLDFSISVLGGIARAERSRIIQPIKKLIADVAKIPHCRVTQQLLGANNSTQYLGEIHYESCLSRDRGKIKVDVGLREAMLDAPAYTNASTLVANPFSGKPLISKIPVQCLSLHETLAEKIRAMFTRKEVAVRDFFDFWHAKRNVKFDEVRLLSMASKKIAVSPYPFLSLSDERIARLEKQLITDLRPVLTEANFQQFSLPAAVDEARNLESHLRQADLK